MNRSFKNVLVVALIALVAYYLFIYDRDSNSKKPLELRYDEFVAMIESGEVKEVTIAGSSDRYVVSGILTDDSKFNAIISPDPSIFAVLLENGVEVKYDRVPPPPWWLSALSTILVVGILVLVFIFIMQQSQGGGSKVMQFGRSRARLQVDDRKKVTFADVAGVDEVKEELQEIVEFLKDPRRFNALGARIPKGVLLYGPPGTGKTLLARAVAGEAGVPFFSISGSDFVEMFVGVGASRVRDLFDQAKKHAPCIIFIDEIDAVGRQRGAGLGGGHDEREQTLNQLLVEMDGFAPNEGIIVVAATNRPDILDPALLRPGRFDREITVDVPDILGRRQILDVHARNKPIDSAVDMDVVARRTPGFTGADLANVLNEAALLAARRGRKKITMPDLEQAAERVIAGPEKKSRVISDKEKRLVSYHEAGHAVAAYFMPNADPLHKISIIPRGRAGGYTLLLPKEDRRYVTKSQMLDEICILLGGRIAEELVLQDISTGAQSDLERATETVRKMITKYGMSDELGPLTFGRSQETVFLGRDFSQERNYSEAIAYAIDKEARLMIGEAYKKTKDLLVENLAKLHLIADALMERETLEADEFNQLMKDGFITPKTKEEPAPEPPSEESGAETAAPEEAEPERPGITFSFDPRKPAGDEKERP
ncbi:MAG: ATP-dependent zinc metalloprotease FtsH [Clostridiales bacterium]|nr:ATP-dependent zinc metalloprotease FtsH [Clostridiales bacterium]